MKTDHSTTFLIEECAGSQDTDLIASTLWLYCQKFVQKDVQELVLTLDNCS